MCCCALQAEVWNVDIAAKSSEFSDVQLSAADVRPGRKVIAEHLKVVDGFHLVSAFLANDLMSDRIRYQGIYFSAVATHWPLPSIGPHHASPERCLWTHR